MLLSISGFFAGMILLYYGAEAMVTGSSRLAISWGMPPLAVGMTVVAFATSMPEFMVSLTAISGGSADIAVGNIIGSNVANVGLILGLSALLAPLPVARGTLRIELPFMLFVSGLFYLLVLDGRLGFGDGLLLCGCLAVFLYRCLRSRRRPVPAPTSADAAPSRRGRDLLLVAAGMVGLGIGAELMVRSAVTLARGWGVSELVIGLTVVAVGTSLPELAASLVGAMRGAADISVGNVLGSNIFNIGFVLGICPLLRPVAVAPGLLRLELPAMLLFSALLLPLAARSLRLGRMQGALLLAGYVGFVLLLFLRGS